MSKKEQDALLALLNSFKVSKRITTFDQLSDGKVLMEFLSAIDATHFKSVPVRGSPGGPGENWVLKMNNLKRLYRLLLSFPLPPPHHSLSLSTLPEPPFTSIAKSPTSLESTKGLLQIFRMCLSIGVWGPGNEMVIKKIQSLGEAHMAELMRSIEEVMRSMPAVEDSPEPGSSPSKSAPDSPPSPVAGGLRADRDKLAQENEELRVRCEQLSGQMAELSKSLEEARAQSSEVPLRNEQDIPAGIPRNNQPVSGDNEALLADLAKAEDNLTITEAELEKQNKVVSELSKTVDELRLKAANAAKLKDELDEYRHTADKLQKSENVIQKYKKKLDESAGLRKELKSLEDENTALINTNAWLQAELKQSGSSKALVDTYKAHIEILERKANEQAAQVAELTVHFENSQAELAEVIQAHERDQEELQVQQERIREIELRSGSALKNQSNDTIDDMGNTSLGAELGTSGPDSPTETKAALRSRIRALQKEVADVKVQSIDNHRASTLEALLADANKWKDRYQADFLEAQRNGLKAQATLDQIRSGRGVDKTHTMLALRQQIEEIQNERDALVKEKQVILAQQDFVNKQLEAARVDLSLAGKDEDEQISAIRKSLSSQAEGLENTIAGLKEDIATLRDKDRLHLEEIKSLLKDKVDLQASGLAQRDTAIERERHFSDIRASLAAGGVSAEAQTQIMELHSRNGDLSDEVKDLNAKLVRAKMFIKDQDSLFRAEHRGSSAGEFAEAQKSYEAQITALRVEVDRAKTSTSALDRRYKLEQQLMLSAWHELGMKTVQSHLTAAGTRRPVQKPVQTSWLGRQRRNQEEASFTR